jgi:hypothetical protein
MVLNDLEMQQLMEFKLPEMLWSMALKLLVEV